MILFENGSKIVIGYKPVQVERGIVSNRGSMTFFDSSKNRSKHVYQIFFEPDNTWIHTNDERYRTKINSTKKPPLLDENFANAAIEILKLHIHNVYNIDRVIND